MQALRTEHFGTNCVSSIQAGANLLFGEIFAAPHAVYWRLMAAAAKCVQTLIIGFAGSDLTRGHSLSIRYEPHFAVLNRLVGNREALWLLRIVLDRQLRIDHVFD